MELTQEEKNLLVQVLSQLNLPVAQAETAIQLKGIITKLQTTQPAQGLTVIPA